MQPAPGLGNEYHDDALLGSYLRRVLPPEMRAEIEPELAELGRLSGGPLYELQLAELAREPVHVAWDAWGNRVDRIELTGVWLEAERLAAEKGIVATPYERRHGGFSRVHGLALAYLFTPSTDFYGCPLAMTDGAAAVLSGPDCPPAVRERALPRLLSRDPATFWTSGQWMTELPGGSDVSRTETQALQDEDGVWRLYGRKWFTSAVSSQMALALARPAGAPAGSRGLALFYLETREGDGRPNRLEVNRLKDKLGTRKLPTAELALLGVPAVPLSAVGKGVRAIAPMLNLTRTWNAMTAAALLGRGLRLARDYAGKRGAFGRLLQDQPLHADTLLGVEAEWAGALLLAFRLAEGLGVAETGDVSVDGAGAVSAAGEAALLRVLTPIAKLTTARQAVAGASELVEAFGGAGYIEDTGIPSLLRDCQVLSIWEGTTNVLALDALRALESVGGLGVIEGEMARLLKHLQEPSLAAAGARACDAVSSARDWLAAASEKGEDAVQAGARRFALQLGRALELALLARHAQWALDAEGDGRPALLARRLAAHGVAPIFMEEATERALLAGPSGRS
ncbi:MAG TPA: acyl-CoA dehydrogenase family protein [Longimicrobiales bacterium]